MKFKEFLKYIRLLCSAAFLLPQMTQNLNELHPLFIQGEKIFHPPYKI